jgi:hypothetical protein
MKVNTSLVALHTLIIFELIVCSAGFSHRAALDLRSLGFRRLKAATRTIDLIKRSDEFVLTNASAFVFVDGNVCTHSLVLKYHY